MSTMSKYYKIFDGRLVKKLERQQLHDLGATEEGLAENYDNTDNIYCISINDYYIFQFKHSMLREENLVGCWKIEQFFRWFNGLEDDTWKYDRRV